MHPEREQSTHGHREAGKVEVRFFPGCLVLSIVLSIVGTILINVLIRLFD